MRSVCTVEKRELQFILSDGNTDDQEIKNYRESGKRLEWV